jgi:hypothetical protein
MGLTNIQSSARTAYWDRVTSATQGLELYVRYQSDFAGFRWCYGRHCEEVSTGYRSKGG